MRPRDPSAVSAPRRPEPPAAAALYVSADDDSRGLRRAVAAAVAFHALLLLLPLPRTAAGAPEPPPPERVFVVQTPRFKPPEIPPEPEIRREEALQVPVPDPTPDDPEPLRPVDRLSPVELPPTDLVLVTDHAPPAPEPPRVLEVGGDVSAPVRIGGPEPPYPRPAMIAHFECVVVLRAVIGADGRVRDLAVAKPCPLGMNEAASEAVAQWEYRPALRHGLPVPVEMEVTVRFNLR